MAEADSAGQKEAWRTRFNAEEAGHSHGGSETPIADDSLTPSMAQADTPQQKEAWRTRFNNKADIADWAEDGNTDPMPRGKYGPGLIAASNFDTTNDSRGTTAAKQLAFRMAIDTKADIADWAEEGNTDDVPTTKIPDLDGSKITLGTMPGDRVSPGTITDQEVGDDAIGNSELKPEVQAQLVPGGGDINQRLGKRSNADHDVEWVDEPDNAAIWAEEGNTSPIPESKIPVLTQDKLPASVHSQFIREHSFVITTGVYTGAKGFNRVTGGGGSATNATWTTDNNQLQLIAFDQTNDGFTEMLIVGTLPSDFNDRIVEITDSTGYLFVLRIADAIRTTPPTDTSYPSGLQNYTSFAWRGQSLTVIQDRDNGDTFTVSLGDTPAGYLEDFVSPWAREGNTDTAPLSKIPELDSSKYQAGSVDNAAVGDDAITGPKLDADDADKQEALRNRIGIPSPATDNDVNKYLPILSDWFSWKHAR